MDKDFFVMLNLPDGGYTPMITGDNDELGKYSTYEEAKSAAENSVLGEVYGFEIFQRGYGV